MMQRPAPLRSPALPGRLLALLAALLLAAAGRTASATPEQLAPEVAEVFDAGKLAEIDAAVERAIREGHLPGGVLWLERRGVSYHRAWGERAVEPTPEVMTEGTVFDVASMTKVLATTPAVMRLLEQGRLELEKPLSAYLPEFHGAGKEAITLRQLFTHTSGLRAGLGSRQWTGKEGALAASCAEPLPDAPGTVLRYSDLNFILLGLLVERVSGRPLDEFCAAEIYQPLGMAQTGFRPAHVEEIAPTTRDCPRGTVHDPTARRMGGVAGHAGLFTTAADVARFARMLLARGAKVLQPGSVALMTSVQTPPALPRRGLGWDIDSPYSGPRGGFPLGSYGHTGWTGGSLWVDPFSETFLIFLSNRNHPTEAGDVLALRRTLGTLAAQAVRGFDFQHVSGALEPRPSP